MTSNRGARVAPLADAQEQAHAQPGDIGLVQDFRGYADLTDSLRRAFGERRGPQEVGRLVGELARQVRGGADRDAAFHGLRCRASPFAVRPDDVAGRRRPVGVGLTLVTGVREAAGDDAFPHRATPVPPGPRRRDRRTRTAGYAVRGLPWPPPPPPRAGRRRARQARAARPPGGPAMRANHRRVRSRTSPAACPGTRRTTGRLLSRRTRRHPDREDRTACHRLRHPARGRPAAGRRLPPPTRRRQRRGRNSVSASGDYTVYNTGNSPAERSSMKPASIRRRHALFAAAIGIVSLLLAARAGGGRVRLVPAAGPGRRPPTAAPGDPARRLRGAELSLRRHAAGRSRRQRGAVLRDPRVGLGRRHVLGEHPGLRSVRAGQERDSAALLDAAHVRLRRAVRGAPQSEAPGPTFSFQPGRG